MKRSTCSFTRLRAYSGLVPAKTVNELNRLRLDKGETEIRYAENQAAFTLRMRFLELIDELSPGVL